MIIAKVIAGMTAPLEPFTLTVDGEPIDLTGLEVSVLLYNADGDEIDFQGDVVVDPDQVNNKGKVTVTPTASDFVFDPNRHTIATVHTINFEVTDSEDQIDYWPRDDSAQIAVYRGRST